jgi:hypothetical protein
MNPYIYFIDIEHFDESRLSFKLINYDSNKYKLLLLYNYNNNIKKLLIRTKYFKINKNIFYLNSDLDIINRIEILINNFLEQEFKNNINIKFINTKFISNKIKNMDMIIHKPKNQIKDYKNKDDRYFYLNNIDIKSYNNIMTEYYHKLYDVRHILEFSIYINNFNYTQVLKTNLIEIKHKSQSNTNLEKDIIENNKNIIINL